MVALPLPDLNFQRQLRRNAVRMNAVSDDFRPVFFSAIAEASQLLVCILPSTRALEPFFKY